VPKLLRLHNVMRTKEEKVGKNIGKNIAKTRATPQQKPRRDGGEKKRVTKKNSLSHDPRNGGTPTSSKADSVFQL